jgi:hypothetical protein
LGSRPARSRLETQDAIDAAEAGASLWVHGVAQERIPEDRIERLAAFGIPMERETVPPDVLDSFYPPPDDFNQTSRPTPTFHVDCNAWRLSPARSPFRLRRPHTPQGPVPHSLAKEISMSFATDAGHIVWSSPPCGCRVRQKVLGALTRALREEPLAGRDANLLCTAVMALHDDPDLDPRAVLQLFPSHNDLLV